MGADPLPGTILRGVELDYVELDYVELDYVELDYVKLDYVELDYVKLDYVELDYVKQDYVESGGGCSDRRCSIFSARVARFSSVRISPACSASSVRAMRSWVRSSDADPAA